MEFRVVNASELKQLLKDPMVFIIDVRSREEFNGFHLQGAHNYPYEQIECWKRQLPRRRKLLLCCEHGNTSLMAARKLAKEGYCIYTLLGGLKAVKG